MTNNTFYLDYGVTGAERKRLVNAISAYTQADAKYLGAPTFAYEVDCFTIDKNGCVSFDDRADSEVIEGLIETLVNQGFVSQVSNFGCEEADEEQHSAEEADGLTISLQLEGFTETSCEKLRKLVDSKAALIRKALGAERTDINIEADKVSFPWWDRIPAPEEINAYTKFISAVCQMAKEARRVTATEKEVASEKYAFRCFLLRLGFIGSAYKAERKILLKKLTGSSAFKNGGADHEVSE